MHEQKTLPRDLQGALFIISIAILLFEMAQIRVFSYSLPAVLSYIGISLAMLGFGISAMLLSLMPNLVERKPRELCLILLLLQSFSMIASSALFAKVAWDCVLNMQQGFFPLIVKILLPCTMPYFFGGFFIAIVFSSAKENIGRLYFWNLVGSAAGSVLITIILKPLGAEKTICTAAIASLVAALLIAIPRHRILAAASALMLIALVFLFPDIESLMPFTPRPNDATGYYQLLAAKEKGLGGAIKNEFAEWNIVGRIDIWKQEGKLAKVPEETEYRLLTVDSGAATTLIEDPGKENWGRELFEETPYGAVYFAKPNPESVVVIGTGGGADIQTALHWGAKKIIGVEINSTTIKAVTGPYASFLGWPLSEKVRLVHEDGRSFIKNTRERFDVIQLSGVDTLTVNATGALNMVEESLYTIEAFEDYISALKPDGALGIIRFHADDIRLSAIAAEALLRLGITTEPHNHIASFRQGFLASIIVSRSKFTEMQLNSIERLAKRTTPNNISIPPYEVFDFLLNNPVSIKYLPNRITSPEYKSYFDAINSGQQGRSLEFNKKAIPTDDNPFFMFMGFLAGNMELPLKNNFALFKRFWIATVFLALVCIMLPVLAFGRKKNAKLSLCWVLPYFALIGLAFMMLEINMINRFTIFMGSPGASIAVVLTSILVASGIGSYISGLGAQKPQHKILLAASVLIIAAVALKIFAPIVFEACYKVGASQALRGLIAGVMLAPLGFSMGWFFPSGLRVIDVRFSEAHLVPWAISINGFTSVVGSVIALPITIWFGFSYLFWLALAGYILAGLLTGIFLRSNSL
jgi:spermidine synthase